MTKVFESTQKKLEYVLVDPDNQQQIADALEKEKAGFGKGIDPVEVPEVLEFIARNGHVWLQYAFEQKRNPTGVIELIPLKKALEFDPCKIVTEADLSVSPLNIITRGTNDVFQHARRFADDGYITYHHGISMSRRGEGYGTLLLNYALGNTPNLKDKVVVCPIDAAKIVNGKLMPAANKSSYTIHMKAGFVLAGVVEPPVYDDTITYYSVVRPRDSMPLKFVRQNENVKFDEPIVATTIQQIRDLTSQGYVGVSYNRKSHEMVFRKIGRK